MVYRAYSSFGRNVDAKMTSDLDLCLTWRCWQFGHHTTPGQDDMTRWMNHYFHVGPLSAYWRSDVAYRVDVDVPDFVNESEMLIALGLNDERDSS